MWRHFYVIFGCWLFFHLYMRRREKEVSSAPGRGARCVMSWRSRRGMQSQEAFGHARIASRWAFAPERRLGLDRHGMYEQLHRCLELWWNSSYLNNGYKLHVLSRVDGKRNCSGGRGGRWRRLFLGKP